jgi:radical SAM superfamily enzyme YgiQ (UPF0313 family)
MPLGMGFLISVLRNNGHKIFFIDNYLKQSDFLETDYIIRNKIEVVGIYSNTICFDDTMRMFEKLQTMREKKIWSGRIIVGGPHTSAAPETIPKYVDNIVQGEGERAILDVIDNSAPRLVKTGQIVDLDSLPAPAWDYFVNLPYSFECQFIDETPVFTMNTSRGCPFNCRFCSVNSVWGRRYVYFSAKRVYEDVKYLQTTYGAKGIYFREDHFTLNKARVLEFCELILRDRNPVKWACETRADSLDYEMVKLMKKAGCDGFYVGVESGSQRMLDFFGKGEKLYQFEDVFRWCNELGIRGYASFVVGAPTETADERRQTEEFARKLKPASAGFNVFAGIPGSELYQKVLDESLYEYKDTRGILYLKGHDKLVNRYYSGKYDTKIPRFMFFKRLDYYLLLPLRFAGAVVRKRF